MLGGWMSLELLAISAFITIFSVGLLLVSILSYKKHKNRKLVFICLVFLLFLIKGAVLSYGLITNTFMLSSTSFVTAGFFDLLILILLFIATLRR